ncbi:hypothetical protein COU49_00035 [Candidatus Nomurabacteria bacterium CG10_big_fil_rev_8_21_14_0_10_35_16]|uniref:Zinc-binding domain-containing protein n=1 Tax=Candidatus Nomurabacteria bacterium CG10_big_fil_rev_8_21_14_0_10_35_16 TaxID=1974731 RepID=A0A2H0TC75_9BACT|nr:MAG: hypothetical protein COU49_00035 [Candidatus Nomurabacteria bacterium CG10_big_fil_rev_8_21_14_0_10_35_16]
MNQEKRKCKKCKNNFILEKNDFSFYKKMKVSMPNICPDCRFKMRAVFRNERTLYNSICALCNKSVITMYNPNSLYTVYCNDCWVSDAWDPSSYAMDYDSTKSFFEQLKELTIKVPKSATYSSSATGPNINSKYTNFAGGNKDGYLIFNSGPGNENCAYSRGLIDSRDVFDVYYGDKIENIYEGVNVHNSNGISWGKNVSDCIDSKFILSCINCQNCFGCVNLRNKSYCFFNEQLEREEWIKHVGEISGSYTKIEEFKKKFREFSLQFPYRSNTNLKTENCSGDYIFESKNCHDSFELSFCEDVKHSFSIKKGKDCMDMIGHCRSSELLYNGVGVGAGSRNVICSWWVESSQDVGYSFATRQSENCFGCDGIKNGKYVILNKKYTKKEYQTLRDKIIEELKSKEIYGEFFPLELAFFAYNETIAQDNMPLSKDEVIKQGFRWEEYIQKTEGKETIKIEDIPDNIKDVPDNFINEILSCVECSRNYRLIERELTFYKKMSIPIPKKCWSCRFANRILRRGPLKFWDRKCMKCEKDIKTNYSPERPEIIYCEQCYQQEVY